MKRSIFNQKLVSFVIYIFLFSFYSFAQEEVLLKDDLNENSVTTTNLTLTKEGFGLGEIPMLVKPDFSYITKNKSKYVPDVLGFASIYDLRNEGYITTPKNQGACGSCWTFATMGAIESYCKKMGYGTYDLSENNLKNCHGFSLGPCEGGNSSMAMVHLSRLKGPVLESADPYNPSVHTCIENTPTSFVMEGRFLPNDPTIIKQAIIDNGALYTNMFWDDDSYNSTNKTYYYNGGSSSTNHAVLLVGWDDTKVTAGGIGAWIIKNSWGTYWGESGYFYISYNDVKVNSDVSYFPTKLNYNKNLKQYFYDDFGWVSSLGYGNTTAYGFVKFTATGNQKIEKLGTWVNSAGTSLTFEIYSNFNGTTLSGLLGSVNLNCDYPGYFVANLPEGIDINSGLDFYIKVKYTTSSNNYPIPIELATAGCSPNIQTGKSWISYNASYWTAIGAGTSSPYNLCIRAYTTPQALVCSVDAGSDKTICHGGSTTITASIADSYSWSTGETTATISVSPTATTTYTVIGTTDGECTASDAVVVYVNPRVSINNKSITICEGRTITIKAYNVTSYNWSNGLDSGDTKRVSPTTTTTYTVTGTVGGCTSTDNIVVVVQSSPSITLNLISKPSCAGNNDGVVESIISSGEAPFTYSWNNGETTQNNNKAIWGENRLWVSDVNGCGMHKGMAIKGEPIVFPEVTNLRTTNVTGNSATIEWGKNAETTSYDVYYKTGSGDWIYSGPILNSSSTSYTFNGLQPNTTYSLKISQKKSSTTYSCFSTLSFTTLNGITCLPVTNMNVENITSTTATLDYTPAVNHEYYTIRYRTVTGPGIWIYFKAVWGRSDYYNRLNISGLTPNTNYEWQVRTVCQSEPYIYSDITALQTFRTAKLKLQVSSPLESKSNKDENSDKLSILKRSSLLGNSQFSINVYPNPFSEEININYHLEANSKVSLEVYNILGSKVASVVNESQISGTYNYQIDNIGNAGVYFVKLTVNDESVQKKIIKH